MSGPSRRRGFDLGIADDPTPPPATAAQVPSTDRRGFIDNNHLVPLASIERNERAQVRVQPLDPATVDAYTEAMRDESGAASWGNFPPVVLFGQDGRFYLADGFHRVESALRVGLTHARADIREGGLREAILHAVSANDKHGLRRNNKDKRHAVEILLRDKEWAAKSDRKIAELAAVSNKFVGDIRREATVNGTQSPKRTGKDGRTINTANIGKAKPKAPSKPGKAATPTTPTRDKATPASPPPEATAGPLDPAPVLPPLVGEAPATPAPFVTLWTPHARAALAAVMAFERARIAQAMCIPEAHVTEADALWWVVDWACTTRGITPDREGEDEYTPPASRLERDITLPGESVGFVDKAGA